MERGITEVAIIQVCIINSINSGKYPPTDSKGAEEATEASEASLDSVNQEQSVKGAFPEHIFSDPLGAQHTAEALANFSQRSESHLGSLITLLLQRPCQRYIARVHL